MSRSYFSALLCLLSGASALAGCENTRNVGSGCFEGMCPQALKSDSDHCIVSTRHYYGEGFTRCISSPLHRYENGLTRARVFFVSPANTGDFCDDKPFLMPVAGLVADTVPHSFGDDTIICEVKQLAVTLSDGGEPTVEEGDGFYYDDFSGEGAEVCDGENIRIAFTPPAAPWVRVGRREIDSDVIPIIMTDEERDGDAQPAEDLVCKPIQGTTPIGTPCLPEGQKEYYGGERVVETLSPSCGEGTCMVWGLHGHVDAICDDSDPRVCLSPPEYRGDETFCSCRCDGPPGTPDLCDCPSDMMCQPMIVHPDSQLIGSYCVPGYGGSPVPREEDW
jgi:hypothetical protein